METLQQSIEKHVSKSVAKVKGHLNQQKFYAQSTQTKKEPEYSMELETNLDDGVKIHCIYAAVLDAG
jgi:hypothetical protein